MSGDKSEMMTTELRKHYIKEKLCPPGGSLANVLQLNYFYEKCVLSKQDHECHYRMPFLHFIMSDKSVGYAKISISGTSANNSANMIRQWHFLNLHLSSHHNSRIYVYYKSKKEKLKYTRIYMTTKCNSSTY